MNKQKQASTPRILSQFSDHVEVISATVALAHRGVFKDKLTPYFRAFQLRRRILRKPGHEALKEIVRTAL